MLNRLTVTLALPYSVHPPSTVVHPPSLFCVNLYGNTVTGTGIGKAVLVDVAVDVSLVSARR